MSGVARQLVGGKTLAEAVSALDERLREQRENG
jgi:hypothetical protein